MHTFTRQSKHLSDWLMVEQNLPRVDEDVCLKGTRLNHMTGWHFHRLDFEDGSGYICAMVFDHDICVWSNCMQIKMVVMGVDWNFRQGFYQLYRDFDLHHEEQWLASPAMDPWRGTSWVCADGIGINSFGGGLKMIKQLNWGFMKSWSHWARVLPRLMRVSETFH